MGRARRGPRSRALRLRRHRRRRRDLVHGGRLPTRHRRKGRRDRGSPCTGRAGRSEPARSLRSPQGRTRASREDKSTSSGTARTFWPSGTSCPDFWPPTDPRALCWVSRYSGTRTSSSKSTASRHSPCERALVTPSEAAGRMRSRPWSPDYTGRAVTQPNSDVIRTPNDST
jgi:hypothetical protein